ncbi:MAG: ABC transporter substrate-binding protein [Chloroflexi bacterium]|nr:ABC transporter substrate-binding protein [Chloroflexota bacterium]MCL5275919.1 ABC transporter substrate-binding protein [Chloroflexota bacterium]
MRIPSFVRTALSLLLLLTLGACEAPRPTIKIALVAPFEGEFREVGYDAFPAMRLALREQIIAGGIGNYQVAFVAYNDNGDAAYAERVAHNVTIDRDVVAVIGHFRADTTLAALHVYTESHLAVVVPGVAANRLPYDPLVYRMGPTTDALDTALERCPHQNGSAITNWTQPFIGSITPTLLARLPDFQSTATAGLLGASITGLCFATATPFLRDLPAAGQVLSTFPTVSGGAAPQPLSIAAYDATRLILQAIRSDIDAHGAPTRAGVADALRHIRYQGLLGTVTFNNRNVWADAPVWVYQFDGDGTARPVQ